MHSVKQGARILDPSGELVGASASLGLPGTHRDVDAISADVAENDTEANTDAPGETEMTSEDTARAVEDVYAALDRLGARTHVYARTIVPLATDDHSAPSASNSMALPLGNSAPGGAAGSRSLQNMELPTLNGPMIAQSSMRTVQHPQQPLQHQPPSSSQHQQIPNAFPTSNLPPFPIRPEHMPPPQQQHQQQHPIEEPMAEIDPSLENSHQGEGLMMVDADTELSLP